MQAKEEIEQVHENALDAKLQKEIDNFMDDFTAMKLAKGRPPKTDDGRAKKESARCQFCDKEVLLLRLCCSKCKQAFFCDKECQVKDWKRQKKTCKASEGAK